MWLAPDVQQYSAGLSPAGQETFDALAAVAREACPSIGCSMRWRAPTFTLNRNWHHWMFGLARTKQGMTHTFHKGSLLRDPKRMLAGDGRFMRKIAFRSAGEIDRAAVAAIIREAARRRTDMLPVH